jgi:hypothetical protein
VEDGAMSGVISEVEGGALSGVISEVGGGALSGVISEVGGGTLLILKFNYLLHQTIRNLQKQN